MSALEEISKLPGYNDDGSIVAPTEEQKADALKYATETGGFPPLALWSMPQFTPAMVKLFTDKEKLVNSYPMTYITNPEKEIIYAVVSAANNCEMCLSFHAMGMGQTLSPEDCKLIVDGGLPTQNERARTIAIAAKYAICHKGLLLEREAAHLESMGVSKEMYGEILFLCGQIHASTCVAIKFRGASQSWPPRHRRDVSSTEHSTHWLIFTQANNMLMVYLIQQGVAVEEMLQAVGPFASTVYAKKE